VIRSHRPQRCGIVTAFDWRHVLQSAASPAFKKDVFVLRIGEQSVHLNVFYAAAPEPAPPVGALFGVESAPGWGIKANEQRQGCNHQRDAAAIPQELSAPVSVD